MLVFIDESGDPGFKVEKGSTPVFAVAMVIFANGHAAEKRRFNPTFPDSRNPAATPTIKTRSASNSVLGGSFRGCSFW